MQRRDFLIGGALAGCSLAASPLVTPIALANAPWDTRLVVIVLRGGLDGLDLVRPYGDAALAGLRPTLIDPATVGELDLDGFFAAHPAVAPLMPLWDAGDLGFYHAVSTPYRDKRSHFDGQDILEAGVAGVEGLASRDGWLNRLLQAVPGVSMETAFAIGREQMLILSGAAAASRWSPEARLALSPQTRRLLELVQHDDPPFRDASLAAIEIAEQIAQGEGEAGGQADMMTGEVFRGDHATVARFAAARLREETRIVSFSLGGFDSHADQQRGLPRALTALTETLLTLKTGLGDVWDRTAVLCVTEFGRTAQENGTRGTDHGTGGVMIHAGGAVRGGRVMGDWPGLRQSDLYDGRDLMPLRDLRAPAGWMMRGLFGVSTGIIERAVFPGVDLGADPGLLR